MIRRRKKDVLKDLPSKTRSIVPVELSPKDMKTYQKAEADYINWLLRVAPHKAKSARKAISLSKMMGLKRLAAELKLPWAMQWIEDFLEETKGKLIVFGIHRRVLLPLYEKYRKISVLVNGDVIGRKKQEAIDLFKLSKKRRLFFGNIQAAGVGWNGTVASTVLFVEIGWTPGEMVQAEDRIHRIGTTKGAIIVYMVAKGTIEHKLCKIVQAKAEVLDQTLDGEIQSDSINIHKQLERLLTKKGA